MNPPNTRFQHPRGVPQPFKRPTLAVAQPRMATPVAPPRTATAQLKTVDGAQGLKRPVAPPVFRPQPRPITAPSPLAGRAGIQLSQKKRKKKKGGSGNKGGKGGLNYTSSRKHYSEQDIETAQQQLGLTRGSKGHGKGNSNSKQSGQTIKENRMISQQLRDNKVRTKTNLRKCRDYHKNDDNIGETCPFCNQMVL